MCLSCVCHQSTTIPRTIILQHFTRPGCAVNRTVRLRELRQAQVTAGVLGFDPFGPPGRNRGFLQNVHPYGMDGYNRDQETNERNDNLVFVCEGNEFFNHLNPHVKF